MDIIEEFSKNEFSEGESLFKDGMYTKALAKYLSAYSTTNNIDLKYNCLSRIAIYYMILEQYGLSIYYANKALELKITTNMCLISGNSYMKIEEYDKAREMFKLGQDSHRDLEDNVFSSLVECLCTIKGMED